MNVTHVGSPSIPFFDGTILHTTMRAPLESGDKGLTINSERKSPVRVHSPFKIRKFRCDFFEDEICTADASYKEIEKSDQVNEGEAELSFGSDQKTYRPFVTRQVPHFSIRLSLFR